MLVFLTGMYLYIPQSLWSKGMAHSDIPTLEKAAKLSILPYAKENCYNDIAMIYAQDLKDGEKAIRYYEKVVNGKYKKFPETTLMLTYMYSYKGDYDRAIKLSKFIPERKASLRIVYIQKGEYQKALDTYDKDESKKPGINFLKASLYRELGNYTEADRLYKLAEEEMSRLKNKHSAGYYSDIEKIVEPRKSIKAYKEYLESLKKEYHFE